MQRSRSEGVQPEVEISCQVEDIAPPMEIRRRIEGLYPDQAPVIIKEIKTTTLSLELVSEGNMSVPSSNSMGSNSNSQNYGV